MVTDTALGPKRGSQAEAGVLGDADSTGREPQDVREGLSSCDKSYRILPKGVMTGAAQGCLSRGPRPGRSAARQYKTVSRGISRLLNYSFAAGTRCLRFPNSPAASLNSFDVNP